MSYNVFGGMLSLTQSILLHWKCCCCEQSHGLWNDAPVGEHKPADDCQQVTVVDGSQPITAAGDGQPITAADGSQPITAPIRPPPTVSFTLVLFACDKI